MSFKSDVTWIRFSRDRSELGTNTDLDEINEFSKKKGKILTSLTVSFDKGGGALIELIVMTLEFKGVELWQRYRKRDLLKGLQGLFPFRRCISKISKGKLISWR